ncbi:MAG: hypothetical protein K6E13_07465 [Lachnospiraceae bacterium]|nr:hypothetical protein [Lachnospiraceae bacterium]
MKKQLPLKLFFIFFICLSVLFSVTENCDAANYFIRWKYSGTETDMNIEKGQSFYIGDFVMITYGKEYYTGSMVGGTYATSAKKIATVTKKGLVKTKKVGTCDITFKYKGKTITAHLNVIAKGGFNYTSQYDSAFSALKKNAKALSVPKKISSGNAVTYLKKQTNYLSKWGQNTCRYTTYDGYANTYIRNENNTVNEDRSNDLVVPQAGRYLTLLAKLREFKRKNDPLSTDSTTNNFKVKKVTGSGSTVTITLKKAISQAQIAAVKIKYPSLNSSGDSAKTAKMSTLIYSVKAKTYYRGNITLKKGSKTVTVKVVQNAFPYSTAVTLTKGTKYTLHFVPETLSTFTSK